MTTTEIKPLPTPSNLKNYELAIKTGLECIQNGQSKADAARAIFELIRDESREVVIRAFIEGATVTGKGAPTYFYNINRQFKKKQNRELKTTQKISKQKES